MAAATLPIALAIGSRPAAAAESALDSACNTLRPHADLGVSLPKIAAEVAHGRRLRIVMLGSSSTEGPNSEDRSRAYPAAAGRELKRLWGEKAVEVVNKGVGGEAVPDMLKRFNRDIYALQPDLVVWQLGVNDLFRFSATDIAASEPAIRKAVADIRAHNIPVVLFDLQYAPRVLRNASHDEMEGILGRVAKQEKAGLFRRFDLMQRLAHGNPADAARLTENDGLHMREGVHACMGRLLGDAIAAAARPMRQDVARQDTARQAQAKP